MTRLACALAIAALFGAAGCRGPEHYYTRGQHAEKVSLKLAYYTRSLEMRPDFVPALRERGAARTLAGEHAAALEDLDRAIALGGDHAKTLCNRAVVRLELDRKAEARADLERAVALEPDLAEAHDNLGRLHELEGRFDDALAAYGRAIEVDPKYGIALVNRGRLRFKLGNFADARSDYLEAIDRNDPVLSQLAHQDLVCTWLAERKLKQALDALTDAQRRQPHSPRWVFLLGALLYVQGQYREAGQCLADAHEKRYQREYCYLFMTLATQRVYEQPHRDLMRQILANEDLTGWPRPILDVYAGTLTPEQALSQAKTDEDKAVAGYYLGELALLDKDPDAARRHFTFAAQIDTPTTPEKHLAALRLLMSTPGS